MLVVTVQRADGSLDKSSRPLDPEDVLTLMRDLVFRAAIGEVASVTITQTKVLRYLPTP